MNPAPKRIALAIAVAALIALAVWVVIDSEVADAKPQATYGVSCMYTRHWLRTTPTTFSNAYCDPGDGFDEVNGDWEVEYQLKHETTGWGDWFEVDDYGFVDDIATCSYLDDNVRIWAFSTGAVDMDVIEEVKWRITIADEYPGNACHDDSSAPTATGIVDSDVGDLSDVPCTSRALTGQYVVEVYHESEE